MSRKSRRSIQSTSSPMLPQVSAPVTVPMSAIIGGYGLNGYQGASRSSKRGYIYWPSTDPFREQDSFTRREIARRVHFLKANVGLPRRMLAALTNLTVGAGLWPQGLTGNREWNRLSTAYYERRASSAITFDVTEKFALGEFQRQAMSTKFADADAAIVYTRSATGRLLRKLYSGLQIGNAGGNLPQERWIDGVFVDALERASIYRFLTADGKRSKDISARDLSFLANRPSPGAVRGESVFVAAINSMIDLTEIRASWVQNIKNSASIGYYLAAPNSTPGAPAMPTEVIKRMYADKLKSGERPNGSDGSTEKVSLKVVMGHGDSIEELPPGYDIKTLLDQRPHTSQAEYADEMIRDMVAGTGLSFDLCWKIYKLGGANTRYMMADAQVFVETQQDALIYGWLMRDYAQTIADGMAAGDLPPSPDPEWWKHGWLPPARLTVDFGRDGRVMMEEYQRGLITTERYFSLKGQDAKEEFLAECDFAEFRREEMSRRKLTEADFDYRRAGTPGLVQDTTESEPQKSKTETEDE